MSAIHTHNVTLYGGGRVKLTLRPLTDEHLPLLYRWNADREVLYWTEGGVEEEIEPYPEVVVRQIFSTVSESAMCFLVEADGEAIGECWLQRMNLKQVRAMYPHGTDVRRIDMCIGEKAWWGRGVGTQMIAMMTDYAFHGERVDVLHCLCEDYNRRSCRVWEKNGYSLIRAEALPQPQIGRQQYHYRLTRKEYLRRNLRWPERTFELPIAELTPSQLYVSRGKLDGVREWFDAEHPEKMSPIPVKRFGNRWLMTDGHTRAVAACLAGWKRVPVYLDEDELDMARYAQDVRWCEEAGVRSPQDLVKRIVDHREYEELWRRRCQEL